MPFLKEYGLEKYPFGLTPNIDLYFPSLESENLLSAIIFSLSRGDGLMKIVGKVGSGKTLISRLLLNRLPKKDYNTAYIHAPIDVSAEKLLKTLIDEFGIKHKKNDDFSKLLQEYLLKEHSKGKRNILILDEAQALGEGGLEFVRLLTNLETKTDKLLQIVLFGQEELDNILHKSSMRQLLQRIGFNFIMKPFNKALVCDYIHYRLENSALKTKTGRKKKDALKISFSPKACKMIARLSSGLPRIIHLLADKSILSAYSDGAFVVERKHVHSIYNETEGISFFWKIIYFIF